jgi:hypothetical protein
VIDNSKRSWRSRQTILALAAVVAVGPLVACDSQNRHSPSAVPPSSGAISTDYVGSHWRLTTVTDPRGTVEIAASTEAWLELGSDGRLLAHDSVNAVSGTFTPTGVGFDVSESGTTLAGYSGNDPFVFAAMNGIEAMTNQSLSSMPSDASQMQSVHVSVLSADGQRLILQAGGVRLTFIRTGPADKVSRPALPQISSAPTG